MENAQAHRFRGAPGHCLMGLATSGQWGCFTLFYSLRKPSLAASKTNLIGFGSRHVVYW
jgi:hypothetical protein